MSAQGTLRYGQMHMYVLIHHITYSTQSNTSSITSLFAALCIHTMCIRRSTDMSQRIAEHRAQLCLLCLKEFQKYWRINNNVLDLFLHYLDGSIAKRLHGAGGSQEEADHHADAAVDSRADEVTPAMAPVTPGMSSTLGTATAAGVDGGGMPVTSSTGMQGGDMAITDLFEEQYLSLVNGQWDMDDAQGELGLFLKGDEFMQEGLGFLGRSL